MVLENFIVDAPIVWDRVGKKIFENPHVKQGRKMRVQITNAGMVEDLSGYTLALGWRHTVRGVDGLDVFEDSSEANVGIFEMTYTENLMTNLGNLKASLVLTSSEDMVIAESNDFYVKVDESPFGADAEQGVGSFTRLAEILLNEEGRIQAFNALVDNEIIGQNVETKLAEKEATFAPRMLSLEQQLADTLNKSAITLTHMFADNASRDAYFVANPTELMEQLFIKVGTGYQQYLEGIWTDSVPIVSEQVSATNQPIVDTGEYFVAENANEALQELGAHKTSTANPHGVTKTQVGLGNVDNTSDANKPISTAMQTALNLKADKTTTDGHATRLVKLESNDEPMHYDKVLGEYVNVGKYWDAYRDGKIYTTEFYTYETSPSPTGVKKDSNLGLVAEPSTNLIAGRDDYANIGLFKPVEVNAYVDANDDYHITAIKGDGRFKRDGTNGDVYIMNMLGYIKRFDTATTWG